MDREDLDRLSQDLLGRPLRAAEFRGLLQSIAALRLGPGSPVLILLVLYQALTSEIAAANSVSATAAGNRSRAARFRGIVLGMVFGLGCAALGFAMATHLALREMDPVIRWSLSEEGKRARRMSDTGLLEALDLCTIPGWVSQPTGCFPGPHPTTGTIHGIRTRP